MSKFIKKAISLALILTMLFSIFAINSFGAEVEEDYGVMPCFTMIDTIAHSFTISGINSNSFVALHAQQSVMLVIKVELQKKTNGVYTTIETWKKAGSGKHMTLDEDKIINIFCDYRIKITCTAGSETHVMYDYP